MDELVRHAVPQHQTGIFRETSVKDSKISPKIQHQVEFLRHSFNVSIGSWEKVLKGRFSFSKTRNKLSTMYP